MFKNKIIAGLIVLALIIGIAYLAKSGKLLTRADIDEGEICEELKQQLATATEEQIKAYQEGGYFEYCGVPFPESQKSEVEESDLIE